MHRDRRATRRGSRAGGRVSPPFRSNIVVLYVYGSKCVGPWVAGVTMPTHRAGQAGHGGAQAGLAA